MPDLDDVYRKFGEVAEAAQLLETELGSLLLDEKFVAAGLITKPDSKLATEIYKSVNQQTSGQLFKKLRTCGSSLGNFENELVEAIKERNRLFHSFYRQHSFRRNSSEGCQIMIDDLEKMHDTILDAYQKILLLSGIDLENIESFPLPTKHVNI